MRIGSRAPTRISFAGGGTDVEPFVSEYGGAVLNVAIRKYNYTSITPSEKIIIKSPEFLTGIEIDRNSIEYNKKLDLLKAAIKILLEKPAEITIFSEIPYRSGLGSSGSAFVSTISAIYKYLGKDKSRVDIAETAWKIEREELKNIGGKQDQYAAAFGGFNFLEFGDDVKVNRIEVNENVKLELEKRIILAYLSPRKESGKILESQTKNVAEKRKETIDSLLRTKELAKEMKGKLIEGDIDGMAETLKEAWIEKRKFSGSITNEYINKIYKIAEKNGALAGKISGAGGGGYMFFIAEEGKEIELFKKLEEMKLEHGFAKFDLEGCLDWVV